MKVFKLFLLVILLSLNAPTNSARREKRTLGTILQFFGYKLVPIQRGPAKETYTETGRNPKYLRINTVIPSTATSTTSTTVTTQKQSSTESDDENFSTTTEMISTTSVFPEDHLTTIFEEIVTEVASMRIISTDPPITTTENSSKLMNESNHTTEASSTTETETSPTETETSSQGPSNILPTKISFLNTNSNGHESTKFPPKFETFSRNPNFELFRSDDLTNYYFGHRGTEAPFYFPIRDFPRPFTAPLRQQKFKRFSSSSASINLNGNQFNYQTLHN